LQRSSIKREIAIAAALFAAGLVLLPPAIYWFGRQVAGEYAGAGPLALADQIWSDLLQLEPAAWVLVLSPFVLVQLVRLIRRTWRSRPV
jgi:hypothetical protein